MKIKTVRTSKSFCGKCRRSVKKGDQYVNVRGKLVASCCWKRS